MSEKAAGIHPVNNATAPCGLANGAGTTEGNARACSNVKYLATRRRRGQASHRPGAQGPGGRSDERREARSPIPSPASWLSGRSCAATMPTSISRATPRSSRPIPAGPRFRRSADAPKRRFGNSKRIGAPSLNFSETIRRARRRAGSRWRERCWPKATAAGAQAAVREAWRKDSFSADLEAQARDMFAGLITPADDKARMDARFDVEDDDAGLRAARHLGAVEIAIAKARTAVINKSARPKRCSKKCRRKAGTIPAICSAASNGCAAPTKSPKAAQWMLAAPHEPERLGDVDQWWVERRLIARKLLDLGDYKIAYAVANGAAPPSTKIIAPSSNLPPAGSRFRFLHEPAVALAHFARIAEGVSQSDHARRARITGRAAPRKRLGRGQEARAYYEAAARYPTGLLRPARPRAGLGMDTVTLRNPPEPTADYYRARSRARLRDSLRHR